MRREFVLCCSVALLGTVSTANAQDWTKSKWGPDDEIGAANYMTPELVQQMIKSIEEGNKAANLPPFSWKTIPQGAATSVWAGFVAPADLVGGKYCEDCHVAEVIDNPAARGGVRPYALDPEHAKALWAKSEEMVGERF